MAGWERNADWNRDVLERIAVLLLALADLADLAAGASFLRRCQVLNILRFGEAEARAFVMGVAIGETAPSDSAASAGDAARLAASFRTLALVLCAVLAQAALRAPQALVGQPTSREARAGRACRQVPSPVPDTS